MKIILLLLSLILSGCVVVPTPTNQYGAVVVDPIPIYRPQPPPVYINRYRPRPHYHYRHSPRYRVY